jgi:FixJ family two-component response regulator
MSGAAPTVYIVDDAREVRMALSRLLGASGYQVSAFESAERFLEEQDELQRTLAGSPHARPIVFLSGKGDVHTGVHAMKEGAVDFLTKPINHAQLVAAVELALKRDAEQRRERDVRRMIQERVETLTPRERQVMVQVIRGRLNKQIAVGLGTGEKTVKVHRARVMSKMGAHSVAELVQLAARVGVAIEPALSVDTATLNWKQA